MAESISRRAPGRPLHVLSWMTWTHFLNDGIANYFPGVLPFILDNAHIPVALAGTLMTALGLGQGLQPVSGWIADRIGGRSLVLGGVALSTIAAALIGWAHPLWLLLCLLFFTGIGNTAFHPQALSLTRKQLGQRPGGGMAVFLVGGEIGRSLGPLAAGLVVYHWGITWIWVMAIPLAVTYPFVIRALPRQEPRRQTFSQIPFKKHIKPTTALLIYSLVRSGIIYEISTIAPIMWHQRGGSLVTGASLITVFIGVGIVGNLLGGTLDHRLGKRSLLLASSGLTALTLLAFIESQGFWEWPVLGLMGIALFGTLTTTMLVGQDIFSENPALGSGIALGLANALGAILAFPLTYIAGRVGDGTTVWMLIVLTLIAMPSIWWMPLKSHQGKGAAP